MLIPLMPKEAASELRCSLNSTGRDRATRTFLPRCLPGRQRGEALITRTASSSREVWALRETFT